LYIFRFIYVDVGKNGAASDAQIWLKSSFREKLLENTLNIPSPEALPGSGTVVPYHIIGDDIFPLTTHLMKPYPREMSSTPNIITDQRIFDYR
jgi:hypothetical protein